MTTKFRKILASCWVFFLFRGVCVYNTCTAWRGWNRKEEYLTRNLAILLYVVTAISARMQHSRTKKFICHHSNKWPHNIESSMHKSYMSFFKFNSVLKSKDLPCQKIWTIFNIRTGLSQFLVFKTRTKYLPSKMQYLNFYNQGSLVTTACAVGIWIHSHGYRSHCTMTGDR